MFKCYLFKDKSKKFQQQLEINEIPSLELRRHFEFKVSFVFLKKLIKQVL